MVIGVSTGLQSKNENNEFAIKKLERESPVKQKNEESKFDHEIDEQEQNEETHEIQIVASDTTVFQDYTKNYYNIMDKEIIKLSLNDSIETHKLKTVTEE